jgi:hypothetical protein
MKKATDSVNVDDEEKLVRQVLAENPIQDVGVRDEWKEHIGWHRKENVVLRIGGTTQRQQAMILNASNMMKKRLRGDGRDRRKYASSTENLDVLLESSIHLPIISPLDRKNMGNHQTNYELLSSTRSFGSMTVGVVMLFGLMVGFALLRTFRICGKTTKKLRLI